MTEKTDSSGDCQQAPGDRTQQAALRAVEDVACAPASLLLEICVDRAAELPGASGAAVGLAQEGELFYAASAGELRGRIGASQSISGSLGGLALSTGETLYSADAQNDERAERGKAREVGLSSLIVAPLSQGRRRTGVLWVSAGRTDAFDQAAVDVVARLARVVSARLDYAQVRDERRRSEQALLESRLQNSALLGALDEGVLILDSSRRVLQANAVTEQILGMSRERLIASNAIANAARAGVLREDGSIWPPEDQPAVRALRTGQPQRDQVMAMQMPDGSLRWLNVTAQPIFDSSGDTLLGVVVTMRDITAGRDRAARLERAERLQDHMERLVPAGTWEWRSGNHLVTWSEGMFRLLGRIPANTAPTFENYLAAVHPDDRAALRQTVLAALRHGGTYGMEHQVVRPDGEVRLMRASGEVEQVDGRTTRAWGCLYDITDLTGRVPGTTSPRSAAGSPESAVPAGSTLTGSTLAGSTLTGSSALAGSAGTAQSGNRPGLVTEAGEPVDAVELTTPVTHEP